VEAAHLDWPALGAMLVRSGLVTKDDLEAALLQQRIVGEKLGKILVDRGVLTAEQLAHTLAEQHELPYVEPSELEPDGDVASLLAPDVARRLGALPLRRLRDGRVLVAVADPVGDEVHELRRLVGHTVALGVAPAPAISGALDRARLPAEAEDDVDDEDEPRLPLLGALLVRDGLVTEEEISSALDAQRTTGRRLGEILVDRGSVTSENVCRRLAEQHDLDFADLALDAVDPDAARLLPEDVARDRSLVPLRFLDEGPLLVALADPTNHFQADRLRLELGVPLRFVVSTPEEIAAALDHVHGPAEPLDRAAEVEAPADTRPEPEPMNAHDVSEPEPVAAQDVPRLEPAHHWPPLGTLLLRDGLVSEDVLDAALAQQRMSGKRLGEILVDRGAITRTQLARALAEQHELPFLELGDDELDSAATTRLPEDLARRYNALPVAYGPGGALLVAVADPTNVLHSDELRLALGVPLRFGVAAPDTIEAAIAQVHQHALAVVDEDESPAEASGVVDVETQDVDTPAVAQVNKTIQRALSLGASDIHFTPQPQGLVVRGRVDGVIRELTTIPASQQNAVTSRLKVMGHLDIAERRAPQDGRIAVRAGDQTVDLRVAVLPTKYGEKVTLRVLNQASAPASLSELDMSPESEELLRQAIRQPFGAVFTCGPTGSGKTTTLYAALQELNTAERTLTTIEDPVEYLTPGIDQVEVNARAGLTFARGLRTVLRSDPDVILVGEIRDEETAQIAVRAAMTGHLVLSTLHTQTAAGAVQRLAEMGIEPGLLAATITCLVAQRLVRRVCQDCRETYYATAEELADLGRPAEEAGRRLLARGRGCGACGNTGFKGRVALFEVLPFTEDIRTLVAAGATPAEIQRAAVAAGMSTLRDDGVRLCLDGVTTPGEVRRITGDWR
jgi:type IV pilus assembly protein PilB